LSDIGTFLVNNPQFRSETTPTQRKTARLGRAVDWSSQSDSRKSVKRFSGDIMPVQPQVFLICSIACAISSSMVRRI
jgi:hypothetical protein